MTCGIFGRIYKLEYMSTRLAILGILREGPLHGYEIKRIIEQRMGDWTSIAFGSIYFALDRMAGEGMISRRAVTREGKRPSRSVYGITREGGKEFLRLLRGSWEGTERFHFEIDMGIAFLDALPRREVRGILQNRRKALEKVLERLGRHEEEQLENPHVPAEARHIFSHSRLHYQAELEWTRAVLEDLAAVHA